MLWHAKAQVNRQGRNNTDSVEININEQDIYENTPLHYAVKNNLVSCVQSLVAHGAFLFIENIERFTPSDLAEKYGNRDILIYLDSKIIFSREDASKNDLLTQNCDGNSEIKLKETVKPQYGLAVSELLEEKERLLTDTAQKLDCSLFTAEIMLKKYSWSKEKLIEAWNKDPAKCCDKCGISSLNLKNSEQSISANENK